MKESEPEFITEITTFSYHFQIDNIEFKSFWMVISRCLISFLLKKSYNQTQRNRYEKYDRSIINNDITDDLFFIIREESSELINGMSLIYYIPTEEIMILKRVEESNNSELEKYKEISIPLMNRYYECIEKEGAKYYLIEYIEGETLDKYDKNVLTYNDKCSIILKLMITIRYLESQRIVYKYLHPNNIIIDKDKEPILRIMK